MTLCLSSTCKHDPIMMTFCLKARNTMIRGYISSTCPVLYSRWWNYHERSNYQLMGIKTYSLHIDFWMHMNLPAFSNIFQHCQSIWEWKPGKFVGYDACGDFLWGPLWVQLHHPDQIIREKCWYTVRCPQAQLGNLRTKWKIIYKLRFKWENGLMGHAMIYICGGVTASYVWGRRRVAKKHAGILGGLSWDTLGICHDICRSMIVMMWVCLTILEKRKRTSHSLNLIFWLFSVAVLVKVNSAWDSPTFHL